jgi:hypothetical protein
MDGWSAMNGRRCDLSVDSQAPNGRERQPRDWICLFPHDIVWHGREDTNENTSKGMKVAAMTIS